MAVVNVTWPQQKEHMNFMSFHHCIWFSKINPNLPWSLKPAICRRHVKQQYSCVIDGVSYVLSGCAVWYCTNIFSSINGNCHLQRNKSSKGINVITRHHPLGLSLRNYVFLLQCGKLFSVRHLWECCGQHVLSLTWETYLINDRVCIWLLKYASYLILLGYT